MVLRHCRWEKKRNEPLLESTADSHFIEETTRWTNRWEAAHHDLQGPVASCGGGIRVRENATVSCGLARSSEQHSMCCFCYQNSIGSTIAVQGPVSLSCLVLCYIRHMVSIKHACHGHLQLPM
ncbi:hypothetical protein NC651_011212 [Populus alba x Populus x berolinensis]|nr:hypothetical protein NC651_011212 [Populus alba x Populus x berolinensis]